MSFHTEIYKFLMKVINLNHIISLLRKGLFKMTDFCTVCLKFILRVPFVSPRDFKVPGAFIWRNLILKKLAGLKLITH